MITGECPNCDNIITNSMPEQSPAFIKGVCEKCNKTYWLLASRIESIAYDEEMFNIEYIVDEKNKIIKKRKE